MIPLNAKRPIPIASHTLFISPLGTWRAATIASSVGSRFIRTRAAHTLERGERSSRPEARRFRVDDAEAFRDVGARLEHERGHFFRSSNATKAIATHLRVSAEAPKNLPRPSSVAGDTRGADGAALVDDCSGGTLMVPSAS